MQDALINFAVKLLSPILIGVITPFAVDALKRVNSWLANAPAAIKQSAAIGVATVATMLSDLLGAGIPTDIAAWDGEIIKVLVAGFLAIAIKQHKQLTKGK